MEHAVIVPVEPVLVVVDPPEPVRERLAVLAKEIKDHEEHATTLVQEALWHKVKIGERLVEAKGLWPHGFVGWGRAQFGWSQPHLWRHMELARNHARVHDLPPGTSLRAALAAIRQDEPDDDWVDDEADAPGAAAPAEPKSHADAHAERVAAFEAVELPADGLPFGQIVRADADAFLDALPPGCAHACVTSPPYWAKRTYSEEAGELGLETEAPAFVERLCGTVDRIGRALVPGGYLFLVLGDTYASQPGQYRGDPERRRGISARAVTANGTATDGRRLDVAPKSLAGIPWRVLLEVILNRGWRCANVIAWVKPNHQPENVHDRLTQTWEPILVLTRAEHAYLRREALPDTGDAWRPDAAGADEVWDEAAGRSGQAKGHLAPFPEWLVARAVASACPPGGVVLDPFAGSGTTLKVATRLGRRFLGCDLAPAEAAP